MKSYIEHESSKAIERFWNNLSNGLTVLLKEEQITKETTVKELLAMCSSFNKQKGETE
jgi:hypothetical protein